MTRTFQKYFFVFFFALVATPLASAQTKVAAAELTPLKSLGSRSAPITVEIFSDFQCPACKRLYTDTLRPLMENYVSTGKVYLVHHDFPLPMHSHGREAARWANAAAQAGVFEKAEEALYAKQETWAANGNIEAVLAAALTPAEMKKVRLNLQHAQQIDAAIDKDVVLGQARRVNQTPSVYVTHNGETVPLPPGGVTYALMKQYLDYLLQH